MCRERYISDTNIYRIFHDAMPRAKFYHDYLYTQVYIDYLKSFPQRVSKGILDFFIADRNGRNGRSYDLTLNFR